MDKSPQLMKSGSDTFKSKLKNLFDTLAEFEKDVNLPTDIPKQQHEVNSPQWKHKARKNRKTTRAMKGKESLFKVPGVPPLPTKNNMPDFRRNPSRWTKYTLADVAAEDMTEASNTAAALSFLNSRKDITNEDIVDEGKVKFKKVIRKTKDDVEMSSTDRTIYKDSKCVMPEYVVGERIIKPKRNIQKPDLTAKELNLSHLHDLEDDDM